MKKFFLIPLMTLVCSVMAWATTVQVGDYQALEDAFDNAQDGDVIEMTQDITIPETFFNTGHLMDITKSITFDGKGHTLYGFGKRGSNYTTIAINAYGSSMVDVVIQNCTIVNPLTRVIETRGNLHSLTIDNCVLEAQAPSAYGYQQTITIGGNQASKAEVNIINSTIIAKKYYPIIMFNPVEMTLTNSKLQGWCSLYFKGQDSSAGSNGSKVNATNCTFDAQNKYTGATNTFGAFVLEDGGIDIVLDNCVVDATYTDPNGVAKQSMFLLSKWKDLKNNVSVDACSMTIKGSNSHIKGAFIDYGWTLDVPVSFDIQGGSYYKYDFETALATEWVSMDDTKYVAEMVNQGGENIYRVHEKAAEKTPGVKYDLNDDVPTDVAGEGNNPSTSFELSIGGTMELDEEREVTTAGYVQVKDNEDSGIATIVKVGTTETADPTQKVDQTLIVNNGLDVQGDSKVEVQAGSALVIGEGGIVTEQPENIVIEADENGAASMIMDPAITVNTTPELTVKMTVPAEHAGYEMLGSGQYRHWHRFAMPVEHMAATWVKAPNVPTYLYGWDYSAQEWAQVGVTEMVPFAGYTLSPDKEISTNTAVTYTFKGKLLGNTNCTLNLNHHGYNFFGNSYTGYISILKLVEQIMGDAKIDGTVWMWDGEKYEGVALEYIRNYGEIPGLVPSWKKEVAPMQTFVLRLTGSEFSSTDINYADAIWGNPRYDAAITALHAPARQAEINDNAIISMSISANGQKESVVLIENGVYSDAYDRGYDAIKYMNENCFNTYVSVNGEDYSTVATDNLEGKMLSIKTNNELAYSMTFDFVAGEEYALRDNATNQVIAIEEGATYEFAAQPNSVVEGRFEIVSRANMPTAIENTEVKANVKGIYTILGQYLGEDFDILPAGVYVVNGVKIVK